MATKGDLLDQERKLEKSGLLKYFHHIEIMSDKKETDYSKLLSHLDIISEEFLMIGNSLKSDILPLINIGSQAIHVPFHTTWHHEIVDSNAINQKQYTTIENIAEVLEIIKV
jgi:putative hydrolase of the HAD superfamily